MQQPRQPHSGISAQQRIATRRQQLLDVAYQMMRSGQWKDLSITALCEQASLNKRYFYESFENLDQLAIAIFAHLSQNLQQIAFDAIEQAKMQQLHPNDFALSVLSKVIDFLADEPERITILFTDQLTGTALIAARIEVKNLIISILVEYAKQHYQASMNNKSIDIKQLDDPMIQLTATLLITGTVDIVQQWISGKILLSKQQLMLDLALLWQKIGDLTAEIVQQRQ